MSRSAFSRGAVLVLLLLPITSLGCRTVPVTERSQFLLMPESQEISMGNEAYQEILRTEPRSTNQQYIKMVNRVGQRIAKVCGVEGYAWEFNVIASDTQNAFCLPGGKVAVYEGILPICHSEAGLAVVMSHEIAHAVARHGGERMSQGAVVDGAKRVASIFVQDYSKETQDLVLRAYGAASNVGVVLPYSRKHESEADAMGLVYMAKAGYDPREAPRFWERFGQLTAGSDKPPEFMSTHPSDARRASDLLAQMDGAIKLYDDAPVKIGLGERIPLPSRNRELAESGNSRGAGPPRSSIIPAGFQAETPREPEPPQPQPPRQQPSRPKPDPEPPSDGWTPGVPYRRDGK